MELPLVARAVKMAQYPGLKKGHVISAVKDDGAFVYLEDGACFKIYSGFYDLSRRWEAGHKLFMKPNPRNPEHPYKLISVHFNEQVEAAWIEDADKE